MKEVSNAGYDDTTKFSKLISLFVLLKIMEENNREAEVLVRSYTGHVFILTLRSV